MRSVREPRSSSRLGIVFASALAFTGSGCKPGDSDVREWRASDHSREQGESASDPNLPPIEDNDPMIAAAGIWQAQCSSCHGATGRGDGPQAMTSRPPDMTTREFQTRWPDAMLRGVIVNGRNQMPAFGRTIRQEGIDVLVRYVRQLGAATSHGEGGDASAPSAPASPEGAPAAE